LLATHPQNTKTVLKGDRSNRPWGNRINKKKRTKEDSWILPRKRKMELAASEKKEGLGGGRGEETAGVDKKSER